MLAKVFGSWHDDHTDYTIEGGSVTNESKLINSMPSETYEWKRAVLNNKFDRLVLGQHKASSTSFISSNNFISIFARVFDSWHNDFTNHMIEAGSVTNELNLINSMPSEIDEWKKLFPLKN